MIKGDHFIKVVTFLVVCRDLVLCAVSAGTPSIILNYLYRTFMLNHLEARSHRP
jgi:hypothetical protein